jgi:hypothetical protein
MRYHTLEMANDAAKIVARWRNNIPPESPKEDVDKVVAEYFPGEFTDKSAPGSHQISIESNALELAHRLGRTAKYPGGFLSLSEKGGRKVKKWLVRLLLDAIELKEEIEKEIAGLGGDTTIDEILDEIRKGRQ